MAKTMLSEAEFILRMLQTEQPRRKGIMNVGWCKCGKTFYQYPWVKQREFCTRKCQEDYESMRYEPFLNQHIAYERDNNWAIENTEKQYQGVAND